MKNKLKTGGLLAVLAAALTACSYNGNPNNLSEVSPADFKDKVDGFSSSNDIYAQNLVAYWNFDGTSNEQKTGTAATSSLNATFTDGGVTGRALRLDSGYVYYARQFPGFATDSLKSFTISQWVKLANNGKTQTMTFQLARPTMLSGNISVAIETNFRRAGNDTLIIHPRFMTQNGGMQDNLNAPWTRNFKPALGNAGKWTHVVVTYNRSNSVLQIWADGVKIGEPEYQNRGTNYFYAHGPSEVIMGATYNFIPGKKINTDASFSPMRGQLDEVRVYNVALPDAHIRALYNLGRAGL